MNLNTQIKIEQILHSKDGKTKKYIQKTNDNSRVETSYVEFENKYMICFSTQVGCNLGCKFCYNGLKHNFKRNLSAEEMYIQIENVIRGEKISNDKPILFSAMGIGEPLLNYENLVNVFIQLNNNYPKNKFALATTGISLKNILRLSEDLKEIESFKLTISLHSAEEKIRNNIMPIFTNLKDLVNTVEIYQEKSGRQVEWNYVLFDGINDSLRDSKKLFELLGKNAYIKINKFNNVKESNLKESKNVNIFINELKKYGMQVEYYETKGDDILGACGQLVSY